jgi:pyruvate dehydrogenase E2 component (dihydrolipoamide acetyltransferase)
MATKVVMEALSPTMEEGRLVEWKKNEGDSVSAGDVLAEVETDKAVMELVARSAGVLLKQLVAAGATVPVSSPVGWIGDKGESVPGDGAPAAAPAKPAAPAGKEEKKAERPEPTAEVTAQPPNRPAATPPPPIRQAGERVKASPLARKIASERGVDLAGVSGTGPEGRIIKRDLETVSGERSAVSGSPARAALTAYEDKPLSQIRKTIAKRLIQSIGPIPTFYLTSEVDMERVTEAREALNAVAGDQGKISFNDIVLKSIATALVQHPECNAWWQDDHIRYWNEVHLGMAVAVEEGLITPVIRNADAKSLRQISAEARELAGRARERKLKPEEYTGATFSVSNLGMFDIEHFTAVINPPEAGIIAIGSIAQVPAVVGGAVVPRRRMRLTMSCDHRVIDGATGAKFLKTVKLLLENPLALVW